MTNDFDKNNSKNPGDIDDFLAEFDKLNKKEADKINRFDEISSGFEKSMPKSGVSSRDSSDAGSSRKTDDEAAVKRSRMDRHSQSKNKGLIKKKEQEISEYVKEVQSSKGSKGDGPEKTGVSMATKKRRKKKKKYRINKKRIVGILALLLVVCFVGTGIGVAVILANTPKFDYDNYMDLLPEHSILYDASGNQIETVTLSSHLRVNVNLEDMPDNLVNAFIAIEDKTFWDHKGFNVVRIFGAVWDAFTSGTKIKGTSTISQQLARNLYLEDKSIRSLTRKIREAYYAVQLENKLSKEQIIEAYLNNISLGFNSNGVQAASQAYFGKDVQDLTLAECSVLATLPKSPAAYAPLKRIEYSDVDDIDTLDIVHQSDQYVVYYNDGFKERQRHVLNNMLEQELITESEHQEALNYDIRQSINPAGLETGDEISSYFADYVVQQVIEDLMAALGCERSDAELMLYSGGLRIHGTIDSNMQHAAEQLIETPGNLPNVNIRSLRTDSAGNILNTNGNIMLYNTSNYFNENGDFVLSPDEYQIREDNSLVIYNNKRLKIYNTTVKGVTEPNLFFKGLYVIEDGTIYSYGKEEGGSITLYSDPAQEKTYKTRDDDGNLIISAEYFEDKPDYFQYGDEGLIIPSTYFQLNQKIIQPQAAMVVVDQSTGGIKVMVGGRNISGKLLYNRADNPRQPGSSIKPIGVYAPALQSGLDMAEGKTVAASEMWTAASIIVDEPLIVNGKQWPRNWYTGFRGPVTMRNSVEQSINVNAVKVWQDIGVTASVNYLKNLGVTTIVEDGDTNDLNPAALALGGMTRGISPLEMTAAYGTIANSGQYNKPIGYTTVTSKSGEILLEAIPANEQVMDEGVAFITRDMLCTTVTNGIAKAAAIGGGIPTGGKTGTTTDQYDAWFVGFSPYYTSALWIGNDINFELTQGSVAATKLWSKVMKEVHVGASGKSFPSRPSNVEIRGTGQYTNADGEAVSGGSEYFLKGTKASNSHYSTRTNVAICLDTGLKATPDCPNQETQSRLTSADTGETGELVPAHYCNVHNTDPEKWPVAPGAEVDPDFKPDEGDEGNGDENENNGENNGNGNDSNGDGAGSEGNINGIPPGLPGHTPDPPIVDSQDDPSGNVTPIDTGPGGLGI